MKQEETFTLRNYERRSNCSLSATFPAAVRVLGLNVGVTPTRNRGVEFETGTFHKVRSEVVHAICLSEYLKAKFTFLDDPHIL